MKGVEGVERKKVLTTAVLTSVAVRVGVCVDMPAWRSGSEANAQRAEEESREPRAEGQERSEKNERWAEAARLRRG
jgi:hypothetical protein